MSGNPFISATPKVVTGTGAPTMVPAFIGQEYIDESTGKIYKAIGTFGSYNWAYIGQGGLSAFTKDSVPGLIAWYKADSGITKDAGNLVSVWADQSDSGFHLAQPTSTNQPLYVENVINGHPVLQFNGTDNTIFRNPFVLAQPYTVFIVGKFITADATQRTFFSGGAAMAFDSQASKFRFYAGTSLYHGSQDTNNHIFTIVGNGNTSHIVIDTTDNAGAAGATGFGYLYIGSYGAGSTWGNINLAEMLIFNSDLSDANRAIVLAELNNKYAIY